MGKTWAEMFWAHWQGSNEPAIVCDDLTVTGNELLRLAVSAAGTLEQLGIPPSTVVPLLMDESVAALALTVGGALTFRPMAPLGTKLPVADLAVIIQNLATEYFVASVQHEVKAREVAELAGCKLHVVDNITTNGPTASLSQRPAPDDVLLVVHTSGTTGLPKQVPMSQTAFAARTRAYQTVTRARPGDRFASTSPFYHVAGAGMSLTVFGMGVAVIPMAWFSVEEWRRVGRLGMTYGQLVPTMIDILLEKGALADAKPRIQQYGASPIHPETLKEALRTLPETRFVQFYGQTEASPLTYLSHEDHLRALAGNPELLLSVGRAVPGCEIAIENPDAQGIGQVMAKAQLNCIEDADGWRRTGDLGRLDDNGYLYLCGRQNDRIIRGGENIYPSEVESVLGQHPALADVAVIGIPNRRWGEIVRAVIVSTDPASPPSLEELRSFCANRLAKFKVPEEIRIVDALPRNATGKLLRRLLLNGVQESGRIAGNE